jgi:N-acetylglucosaminyldiphosphoundecaprenol N-acetyl-beta-D-mannosaminyltransferase
MKQYFNVFLEFDKAKVQHIIIKAINQNQVGYVCAIESNNLTIANKNSLFREVVNHALVNVCDGSNIAFFLRKIHKQDFTSYVGNDIFTDFIKKKQYRHYFIGNTSPVLESLKNNLAKIDPAISQMKFIELPFLKVEEFDYPQIAKAINKDNPDLIWVSLGVPKQEFFMSLLSPHMNRGVMLGVGAAFNFNASTGNVKRAPLWMRKTRMEWLYRAIEEPKKNIPRYWNFLRILPLLLFNEWKKFN